MSKLPHPVRHAPDGYAHIVQTPRDPYRTVCHRDGSVSWWSVYTQTWHRTRVLPPDQDMAAMNAAERRRIALHLAASRHEGSPAAERYLASIRTVRHA